MELRNFTSCEIWWLTSYDHPLDRRNVFYIFIFLMYVINKKILEKNGENFDNI